MALTDVAVSWMSPQAFAAAEVVLKLPCKHATTIGVLLNAFEKVTVLFVTEEAAHDTVTLPRDMESR